MNKKLNFFTFVFQDLSVVINSLFRLKRIKEKLGVFFVASLKFFKI